MSSSGVASDHGASRSTAAKSSVWAGCRGRGNATSCTGSTATAPGAASVLRRGRPVHIRNPGHALRNGIVLIPEDRGVEGLHASLPVRWNLAMATLPRRSRLGLIDMRAERRMAAERIEQMAIKVGSPVPAGLGAERRNAAEGRDRQVHGGEPRGHPLRRLDPRHRRADEIRVLRDAPQACRSRRRVRPLFLGHRGARGTLRSRRGFPRRRARTHARGRRVSQESIVAASFAVVREAT